MSKDMVFQTFSSLDALSAMSHTNGLAIDIETLVLIRKYACP